MAHTVFVAVSSKLAGEPKKTGRIHPMLGGLTLPERIAYELAKQNHPSVHLLNTADTAEILSRKPGPQIEMTCHPKDSPVGALADSGASGEPDDSTVVVIRGDRIYGSEILAQALATKVDSDQAVIEIVDPGSKNRVGITIAKAATIRSLLDNISPEDKKDKGDKEENALLQQTALVEKAREKGILVQKEFCDSFWHPVEEKRDFKPALNALFKSLGKSIDGWVAKHFNRPVSQAVSKRIANLPLSPNLISAVVFIFGLSSAALTITAEWLWIAIGAVVFHFASVFDGIDGEIARVKYQSTKFGALLDSILDHIVLMFWVLAVSYVIHWRGGHVFYLISGWVVFWFTAVGTAVVNYNQITKTKGGQPMELKWDFEKEENKKKLSARFVNSVKFLVGRDVDCVVLGMFAIFNTLRPIVIISVTVATVYFVVVITHQAKKILQKHQSQPSMG